MAYDDYDNDDDLNYDDYDNDDDADCDDDGRDPEGDDDADCDDDCIDGVGFANPGGNSALRAATRSNPRNLPCPTCGRPNRLTPLDRARGYQCDDCADALEGGYGY